MTTITAQTILSSEHAQDPSLRLTTLLLRLPRWIHAENRTHRALRIGEDFVIEPLWPALMEDPSLSRNAGSSRAIPIQKMIQDVIRDTAVPLYWGKARKGMQATEETHALVNVGGGMIDVGEDIWVTPEQAWLLARDMMVHIAKAFDEAGYHKQVPNRLLEPFSHITVLVTATNWSNFLALRDHGDAEPHIRMLAQAIRMELEKPAMQVLHPYFWHRPFVTDDHLRGEDRLEAYKELDAVYLEEDGPQAGWHIDNTPEIEEKVEELLTQLSVARCASTSYRTVDGFDMTFERAKAVFKSLLAEPPIHASPAEHVAMADDYEEVHQKFMEPSRRWAHRSEHRNFVGFRQYRAMLPSDTL